MNESSDTVVPPVAAPANNKKWVWGCGIGCLGFILIAILAAIIGTWFAWSFVDDLEEGLIAQGLTKQSGHIMVVDETVTEPNYYKAQIVLIQDGSEVPIGLLCQMAELRGEYHQPVFFRGQILTIHKDAVLHQGLDVTAQIVERVGKVEGDITGNFQVITETSAVDYTQFENMQ